MSKGNTFEDELLDHILNNADIANIGDATGLRGSTTAGNLYLSLHTADPGEGGNQTTNEATYTSYARLAVTRSTGSPEWTVSSGATNANDLTFAQCTGGSNTITHVGVGTSSSGTGKLLYSAALSASLAVSNLITPRFQAGQITITED